MTVWCVEGGAFGPQRDPEVIVVQVDGVAVGISRIADFDVLVHSVELVYLRRRNDESIDAERDTAALRLAWKATLAGRHWVIRLIQIDT